MERLLLVGVPIKINGQEKCPLSPQGLKPPLALRDTGTARWNQQEGPHYTRQPGSESLFIPVGLRIHLDSFDVPIQGPSNSVAG